MREMTKQQVAAALSQPNGAEKLFARADEAFPAAWALFTADASAQACAFLCRCAKQKRFAASMNESLGEERTALHSALAAQDHKLRKNAARLAGALGGQTDAPTLIAAIKKETQRYAIPSMLLALGAVGGEEARAFLAAYAPKKPKEEGDKRHYEEELAALADARKRLISLPKHAFRGLDRPYELELRTPARLSGSLLYELEEAEIPVLTHTPDSVTVETADMNALLSCRSFAYPLFPLLKNADHRASATAVQLHRQMKELLCACYEGEPPFGYRIEVKGEARPYGSAAGIDRAALAKGLAAMLDSAYLANAPSDYEAEVMLEPLDQNASRADFYLRLSTLPDDRFAYRVGALPASIHPATAAAVLRYAMEHMRVNARVLDPCCGSGTLLIERGKLAPTASLTGVDIAHKAIDIARENAAAANSPAKFVCNDLMRFEATRKYDEILANLPFGNRVGTHKNNEQLYAALLDRLPKWLNPDGVAILYTMEFTLLKKLVRERAFLRLVTETRTEAGGLLPGVFIIKLQ